MIDDILVFSKHSALSVVSPSLSVTFSRLVQFLKAAPSIVVTEEGISIAVRLIQLLKAELPIDFIVSGRVIFLSPEQSLNKLAGI